MSTSLGSKSHKRNHKSDLDDNVDDDVLGADRKDNWIKGLYILLFFAISYLLAFVMFFAVVFQFICDVIFKKPNEYICEFSASVSIYAAQIIQYISYNTEKMPFPFSPWPKPSSKTFVDEE